LSRRSTFTAIFALCLFGPTLLAGPGPVCSSFHADVPIESAEGTSAVWANLRGKPESVRAQSKRLLDAAETRGESASPPEGLCPSYCRSPARPQIVFSTTPTDFLEDYSQFDKCEQLLQFTSESPFRFDPLTFETIDELNDWVQEFTRGKGPEGHELYRRCDGKCSPQYVWTISPNEEKLTVETAVTCGHARDRDVNRYKLASSLRWVCAER